MSKFLRFFFPISGLLACFMLLSGCSADSLGLGRDNPNVLPTPTLPSLLPEVARGFQPVSNSSCLVAQYTPITTDKAQGDLMSWRPASHELAYVAPSNDSWSWYIGILKIVDPIKKENIYSDINIKVFGDLQWSPGGASLAFIALQANDVYTAMILQPDSNQVVDLFPGQEANTDEYASKKGIVEWNGDQSISVSSACGLDCAQIIQFDRNGSGKQVIKDTRPVEVKSMDLSNNQIPFEATEFPKMTIYNWSPDGQQVVYADEDDLIWVLNANKKTQYQLGWLGDFMRESKWSSDSQYLAIRMDNKINVYKTECQ